MSRTYPSVERIVLPGLFIAMSITFTRLFSLRVMLFGTDYIRLGFGGLPIIIGGIIFGPVYGFIIGASADILGYLIAPVGCFHIGFTISSGLTGLLPPFFLKIRNYSSINEVPLYYLTGVVFITQIITSCLLVPYFLMNLLELKKDSFYILALNKGLITFCKAPVYGVILKACLVRIKKFSGQNR